MFLTSSQVHADVGEFHYLLGFLIHICGATAIDIYQGMPPMIDLTSRKILLPTLDNVEAALDQCLSW